MKNPRRSLLTPLLLAVATWAGSSRAAEPAAPAPAVKESAEIVFPGPPEKPRIRYLRSIKSMKDLQGKGSGLFSALFSFLAGGDVNAALAMRPYGIWVRGDSLYLTDTDEPKVVRMDLKSRKVKIFGGQPGAESGLGSPVGVTSDESGNVYVTDTKDHSVRAYDPDAKLLWRTDVLGTVAGSFKKPGGISWTKAGELQVLDTGNGRIVLLSPKDGKVIRQFCRNREKDAWALPNPANLWVEPEGSFIITDPLMGRVHIFTSTGGFISGFGEMGDSAGYMARPRGVASDSDGNVYVVDALFNRVQLFDRQGRLLMFFGGLGSKPGQLALPAGIFIDKSDKVYVVDSSNQRVQVFQYIKYPPETPSPASTPSEKNP